MGPHNYLVKGVTDIEWAFIRVLGGYHQAVESYCNLYPFTDFQNFIVEVLDAESGGKSTKFRVNKSRISIEELR